MRIIELADRVAVDVRASKESWLRDQSGPDADTNIRNVVHGYRGERPVVVLMPLQTDRDETLRAAWLATKFFGCDAIAFTTESWRPARQYVNRDPYTGKPWAGRPRSMQRAVVEWYALEEGVILDCLMTQVVNRAGDIALVTQDYRVNRRLTVFGTAEYTVEWLGEEHASTLGAKFTAGGIVTDALIDYMNQPTGLQDMARVFGISGADFDLDDVETMAHSDCGAVRAIIAHGTWSGAVMLMSDDPKRSEILDASLGHLPQVLHKDTP